MAEALTEQVDESLTVSDEVESGAALESTVDESLLVSDEVALGALEEVFEALGVAEDFEATARLVEEALAMGEDLESTAMLELTVDESLSVSDEVEPTAAAERIVEESASVSDEVAPEDPVEVFEALSVTEEFEATARLVEESLTVGEELESAAALELTLEESLSVDDELESTAAVELIVEDSLSVGDELAPEILSEIFIGVSISEGLESSAGLGFTVDEALFVSDEFVPENASEAAEALNVSESLETTAAFGLTLAEAVTVGVPLAAGRGEELVLAVSLSVTEYLANGSLQVENVGGGLVRVTFPTELHYDGISNPANYALDPVAGVVSGAPLALIGIEPRMSVLQEGSAGGAVPEPAGNGGYELGDGLSTFFRLAGHLDPVSNVGDLLTIASGQNAGLYQILEVVEPGPPEVVVRLDRPLVLVDGESGIHSIQSNPEFTDLDSNEIPVDLRLMAMGGNEYTFRIKHPAVTEANPIRGVYRVVRTARAGSTEPVLNAGETEGPFVSQGFFSLSSVTMVDYRTFRVVDAAAPSLRGASLESIIDRFEVVIQLASSVVWQHTTGVVGVELTTSKLTEGAHYHFQVKDVFVKLPKFETQLRASFEAQGVPRPRITDVAVDVEGVVIVTYDERMQQDPEHLNNPRDYVLTGPTEARVRSVRSIDDRRVALITTGLGTGQYTLSVSTNTPKDLAGNPLDAGFSGGSFSAVRPRLARSIFTDKGPIVKPPRTLQSGTGASLEGSDRVTIPGGVLTLEDIGKWLEISGSEGNDGSYEVLSIVGSGRARVRAAFALPEANDGGLDWTLIERRTGQIADNPNDVVVRVGGTPVVPEAVVGLLGQVILPSDLAVSGDVELDYSWFSNPKVEIRRLNSPEFRLNTWGRNPSGQTRSGHQYRFNNVLVSPGRYDAADMRASLEQPLVRDVKYRAYERAYTPLLNDPTRLLFNTPIHRIAFPPARRVLQEESVAYEATGLPEAATSPWTRRGAGTAVVGSGTLVVVDNSTGTFPGGSPLFWTRPVDLTFEHVLSIAWRVSVDAVTSAEGVWTGLAAGYANARVAYVLGYLEEEGVRKVGFLRRGAREVISTAAAWGGGVDAAGLSTGEAAIMDWSVLRSYRLFTDRDGVVKLYVDGSIVEALRITPEEAPFLEELDAPFDEIQSAFFGSLSRPATSTSTWDFYRYVVQPSNAFQTAPSSFVAYEGDVLPEEDPSPWTPVGSRGVAATRAGTLVLDSTSATDPGSSAAAGLVGGDFRGYVKIEPLLSAASQVVIDARLQLLTLTHGADPDGLVLAVDDGSRLIQLCFIADAANPRLSYGGRSFPEDFAPYVWAAAGSQSAVMRGDVLRIADASATDGKVYSIEDVAPPGSSDRVLDGGSDYIFEARFAVSSYEVDADGFAGAFVHVIDATRSVGIQLIETGGTQYVAFHSEGDELSPAVRFEFAWAEGGAHTYRVRKDTAGALVSLFVDGVFLGSTSYSNFAAPASDEVEGLFSFGSATPASAGARSVVDWSYCNAWRVEPAQRRYIGLWKGTDRGSLTGYHLPTKASGTAMVVGNVLTDSSADFGDAGVAPGDRLVVDAGPNKGVYAVEGTEFPTKVTIPGLWPVQPSTITYRIVRETDWSTLHTYRLARDSSGAISVTVDDDDEAPAILVDYGSTTIPTSAAGLVGTLSNGLPAIAFGSFSAAHLEQSRWDFVRYGITRRATDQQIVPPHEVLNQWNVMESAERLAAQTRLPLTSFKSSSTGITPQTEPDFLERADVPGHTRLNEGTPPVPLTQSSDRRGPFSKRTDEPGEGGYVAQDGASRFVFSVPKDVLYTSLQLVDEVAEGVPDLLAPFGDAPSPQYGGVNYQKEVCLAYGADVLPEDDVTAPTPWALASDNPDEVVASVAGGVLTYGTGDIGTKTVYLNNTPLPDAPSLRSEVTFRLRLAEDTTLGTGDSEVRFGLSAPGMTVGLGFVTHPNGERFVQVYDLNSGDVMGRATVDYLDGAFHTYRIARNPGARVVDVLIDV